MKSTLARLQLTTSIFNKIPNSILQILRVDEFYVPGKEVDAVRVRLECLLDHYVVAYKRNIFLKHIPLEQHLCAHIEGARLNAFQALILQYCERLVLHRGVSFVVYQKPLKIIPPRESVVAKFMPHRDRISL